MDALLDRRYDALFTNYQPGSLLVMAEVKLVVGARRGILLALDATLVLVALYDSMIVRAYSGPISQPGLPPIPPTSLGERTDFRERVLRSLDFLFGQIAEVKPFDELASSHDVLKAIENGWETLSEYFDWR